MFPRPSFPTPVSACVELGTTAADLWLKNDGLSHPVYGGNKVRKAERLVAEALRTNARRVLSFGAVGSHHLLTLAAFAGAAGLASAAIVVAQPRSPHVVDTLRAALGLGLEAHPASASRLVPWVFARAYRRGDYVIPPGGSNTLGTSACADAVDELLAQIGAGLLPIPDWIVTPVGSGGTCAGLVAGLIRRRLPTCVLAVEVLAGPAPRAAARWLAHATLRVGGDGHLVKQIDEQLWFDSTQVGAGYGQQTQAGMRATEVAQLLQLELDPTYTAKAFASLLELLERGAPAGHETPKRKARVLYWHTLAATPLAPLLRAAPEEHQLPAALLALLR